MSDQNDFAAYQAGVIADMMANLEHWTARNRIASTLRGYHEKIAAQELEIKTVSDLVLKMQAREIELEAQLAALKNPPYTLHVDHDDLAGWWWEVRHGTTPVWGDMDYDDEYTARQVGQRFLDTITAPFAPKE